MLSVPLGDAAAPLKAICREFAGDTLARLSSPAGVQLSSGRDAGASPAEKKNY